MFSMLQSYMVQHMLSSVLLALYGWELLVGQLLLAFGRAVPIGFW